MDIRTKRPDNKTEFVTYHHLWP